MESSPSIGNRPQEADNGLSTSDRSKSLEEEYVRLLERRIRELQRTLDITPEKSTPSAADPAKEKTINEKSGEDGKGEGPKGPKPQMRIRFRERRPDEMGIFIDSDVKEEQKSAVVPKDHSDVAMVWLRVFDDDPVRYDYSEVDIQGVELKSLLQIGLAHYPNMHFPDPALETTGVINFVSPFEPLIHNWQSLNALANWEDEADIVRSIKARLKEDHPAESPFCRLSNSETLSRACNDLKLLLEQVRDSPDTKEYFAELDSRQNSNLIAFKWLWTIFQPGELVYSTVFNNRPQVFIVKKSRSLPDVTGDLDEPVGQQNVWHLVCWTYDWDGKIFKRVPVVFYFSSFQGTTPIKALPTHPLRFHEYDRDKGISTEEELKDILIERGRRFMRLCTDKLPPDQLEFHGEASTVSNGLRMSIKDSESVFDNVSALFAHQLDQADGTRSSRLKNANRLIFQKAKGPVVLDTSSFNTYVSRSSSLLVMGTAERWMLSQDCRCTACQSNTFLRRNQKTFLDGRHPERHPREDIEQDLHFLLCPPRVLGYLLAKRTWMELDISEKVSLQELQNDNMKNFKALQLRKTDKDLVRDLVQGHSRFGSVGVQDFVRNKGQGLVILLHGPPGVGKTLTAETVAEVASKPLLSITVADIGAEVKKVQENLQDIFELAARWQAVLLFDEADVFLEARSSTNTDLQRSAHVAVLLRALEYYDGILILTTNRLSQFDVAVQSRVSLGIKYENLTRDQKCAIFSHFINEMSDETVTDREELKDWFRADEDEEGYFKALNGRQIRNVVFSAISLALSAKQPLGVKHVKRMAQTMHKFQHSIQVMVDVALRKAEV